MLEKGTSGLMSGEGKRAAASRPRTALFLDSTNRVIFGRKWTILPGHGLSSIVIAPGDFGRTGLAAAHSTW
jgi:hypothetical protein